MCSESTGDGSIYCCTSGLHFSLPGITRVRGKFARERERQHDSGNNNDRYKRSGYGRHRERRVRGCFPHRRQDPFTLSLFHPPRATTRGAGISFHSQPSNNLRLGEQRPSALSRD